MAENPENNIPLCVDLDGTLVNTDTLVESALLLAKKNPLYLFSMLFWLLSGKAYLKEQIASRTSLDVEILPYNDSFLTWLKEQHASGRELVLVTAANRKIAAAVSEQLPLFSTCIASTSTVNMGAERKRDELIKRFGEGGYDYAGNSSDDFPVWSKCRRGIVVNASSGTDAQAAALAQIETSFPSDQKPVSAILKAMRPHQWAKNLLIFVSIIVAHQYTDSAVLVPTLIAFASFCLCSSTVYLINDLLDLQADRRHATKHRRPFAAGDVPLLLGVIFVPVLLAASAILAVQAGPMFCGVLALYFAATLAYSFVLKRIAMLDVLVLAILYTLRIVAGASVAGEFPSVWLVSFSMFLFTSLAMAKRYAELKALEGQPHAWAGGRGYNVDDMPLISQLGATSGYIATLVLALYIDSPEVITIHSNEQLMWLLCPLLMYWIGRIWLVANRGQLAQDPVIFATRDRASYIVFLLGILTLLAAR
ncbi:MAG: 4-hydroxybenzoate polyprenyltransferase/phosphoserine phosphatase [Halioglobus sp.]|jgi:4-hydroxybenzoate polyprenyltransferase/phosphoserine phosphatase